MSGLSAYKGDLPYIFISYAHRDSEQVFPLLQALQDAGYRIWFDHGIEAGTEWSNNIAEHLSGCSAFLFFASQNSVASENCLDEVAYAKSHNKPALLAYLEEDVVLPSGTDMQTARFQRMYINRQPSIQAFVDNFSAAAIFDVCRGDAAAAPKTAAAPIPKQPAAAKKSSGKGLLIGIIAAVVAIAALVVLLILPKDPPADNNQDNEPTASSTPDSKPPVQEELQLSDALSDHTFRMNGVVYKLPFPYTFLVDNGWALSSSNISSETYVGGQQDVSVDFSRDGKRITAYVYNDGDHAKKLKDCLVGAIELTKKNAVDFCVAAEMGFNATETELVAAFGTPNDRYESSNYTKLVWENGGNSQLKILLYPDNSLGNTITISNYVLSTEKFESKQEAPKYLDSYTAPAELGSDVSSGSLSIEGKLYSIPAPMREFLNDGWTISSGAGAILSGGTESMTLKKGDSTLSVKVANPSLYKTTPNNCIVISVVVYGYDKASVTIPGGIAMGMSGEEVQSLVSEDMTVYNGSTYTSYSYDQYAGGESYSLNVKVDLDTNAVSTISISYSYPNFFIEE